MGDPKINPNLVNAQASIGESRAIQEEPAALNPDLGNVSKPSAWALAGRIVLGICTLCLSELIRAIVNAVTARSVSKPKLVVESEENDSENAAENKINDFVDEVKGKSGDVDVSMDTLISSASKSHSISGMYSAFSAKKLSRPYFFSMA